MGGSSFEKPLCTQRMKSSKHAQVGGLGDAEREVERGHQADQRLPEELLARTHALGVLVHHLAPVVDPADGAEADRHQHHDPDEAVAPVEPQQRRHADADQHQHAAHRRRAALGEVRLHAVVADRLADLQRGQAPDDPGPERQADQQRRHRRHHGAEGQVLEDAEEAELGRELLQPLGEAKQHGGLPARRRAACDHALHLHEARALDDDRRGAAGVRASAASSAGIASKWRAAPSAARGARRSARRRSTGARCRAARA